MLEFVFVLTEPLKVLQAPTTDPLNQVTSDLSTSAALPPTTVGMSTWFWFLLVRFCQALVLILN